jgi:urease accessory protein
MAAWPALAHSVGNSAAGFTAGFLHPPSGLDHLLAMVSVGIWEAELGAPAIWLLPIAFPLIMACGGALGVIGVPLPAGELLIALSVVAAGSVLPDPAGQDDAAGALYALPRLFAKRMGAAA